MLTPLCGSAHWVVRLRRTPCRAWAPGLSALRGLGRGCAPPCRPCRGAARSAATPIRRQPSASLRTGRYGDLPLPSVFRAALEKRWGPRGSPRLRLALAGCDSGWPRFARRPGLCPPTRAFRATRCARECAKTRAAPPSRVATRPPGAIRPPDPRGRLPRCRALAAGLRPHPVLTTEWVPGAIAPRSPGPRRNSLALADAAVVLRLAPPGIRHPDLNR